MTNPLFQKDIISISEFSKEHIELILKTAFDLKKNPRTNVVQVVPELTNGAKRAELDYVVLEKKDKVSLVDVKLYTGRSHQIRVQLKNIGCPIYGDVKYGIYITGLDKKGSIGASNVEIDDIVLEINDEKLYNMNSLTAKLNSLVDYKIGDTVKIKYWDRSLGSIVEEMITLK